MDSTDAYGNGLLANVPRVCTHSLRGLWATLSIESGALSDVVASSLGHGSFEMTAKHYAQPEAVSGAKTQRVVELLELDRKDPSACAIDNDGSLAEQILAQLPANTIAALLRLAMARGQFSPTITGPSAGPPKQDAKN